MHVCTSELFGDSDGQKRTMDPVEQELELGVCHHVVAWTPTKSSQ